MMSMCYGRLIYNDIFIHVYKYVFDIAFIVISDFINCIDYVYIYDVNIYIYVYEFFIDI